MNNTIYTPEIEAYANSVADALAHYKEDGVNFYEKHCSLPAEKSKQIMFGLVADTATENFLSREEQEYMLSRAQMELIMKQVMFQSALENLRNSGLVDTIDDEKGEEMIFLTEKGKKLGEVMFGTGDEQVNSDDNEQ
jgi:hypothetical protein